MDIRHNKFDFSAFSRKSVRQSSANSRLFRIAGQSPTRPKRSGLFGAITFALMSMGLIAVIQGVVYLSSAKNASTQILGAATSAYSELSSASQSLVSQNFSSARGLFVSAQNNIRIAQEKLGGFAVLKFVAPQAKSADHMLSGASALAQAGDKLSQGLSIFEELKVSSQGIVTEDITDKILANRQLLHGAKVLVDSAAEEFNQVASVPNDYSETLSSGKEQVAQLSSLLGKLIGLEDLYLGFFSDAPRTYLLAFQNYDEARATGGFIGTIGVLKTSSGKINYLKISSVYDLDGQITQQIAAPGPFQPLIRKWGLRDANWFADFPTSARKLLNFFELGGETADGIISVTPQLFSQLLTLIGPIEMDGYGVTLTADNFQQIVQFETSINFDPALNQPKKFLADFAPLLLDRLIHLDQAQWLNLFQILQDNLNQKQVLVYSKDAMVQAVIEANGFSGQILSTDYDYLNVVNSNLGGTKTDLSVIQKVDLNAKILSDGSVLNTLVVSRDNQASENNRDFIRVLVPLGSELLSAQGLDPYDFQLSSSKGMATDPDLARWDQGQMMSNVFVRSESGKTEFSGWLNTAAGENKIITLTYMSPFKVNQTYSLLIQKQDGSKPYEFTGQVNVGSRRLNWSSEGVETTLNGVAFNSNSASDDFWGIIMK